MEEQTHYYYVDYENKNLNKFAKLAGPYNSAQAAKEARVYAAVKACKFDNLAWLGKFSISVSQEQHSTFFGTDVSVVWDDNGTTEQMIRARYGCE